MEGGPRPRTAEVNTVGGTATRCTTTPATRRSAPTPVSPGGSTTPSPYGLDTAEHGAPRTDACDLAESWQPVPTPSAAHRNRPKAAAAAEAPPRTVAGSEAPPASGVPAPPALSARAVLAALVVAP